MVSIWNLLKGFSLISKNWHIYNNFLCKYIPNIFIYCKYIPNFTVSAFTFHLLSSMKARGTTWIRKKAFHFAKTKVVMYATQMETFTALEKCALRSGVSWEETLWLNLNVTCWCTLSMSSFYLFQFCNKCKKY